jgi:hypothetical protein
MRMRQAAIGPEKIYFLLAIHYMKMPIKSMFSSVIGTRVYASIRIVSLLLLAMLLDVT